MECVVEFRSTKSIGQNLAYLVSPINILGVKVDDLHQKEILLNKI